MATDTRVFNTTATDSSVGIVPWGNQSNALASDNAYSNVGPLTGGGVTNYLKLTNTSHSSGTALQSTDTINSITFKVEKSKTGNPAANCRDYHLYPVEGGSIVTTTDFASASDWGTSDATSSYVQNTNLPSASTILASDWGMVIAAYNQNSTTGATAQIDFVSVDIDFTTVNVYNETAAGGDLCGTSISESLIFNPSISGGDLAAGTAAVYGSQTITPTGGALCAGSGYQTYNETANAGDLAAGTATITTNWHISGSGTALCGGSASVNGSQTISVGGGAVCGKGGYSNGYLFRLHLSTAAIIPSDQDGFPLLVRIPNALSFTSSCRFETEGGSELRHEVIKYQGGTLYAAVRIDLSTAGNSFYVYY